MLERGDGLNLAIETLRQLRPHVPYSVSLLSNADATRIANVRSFADALRLAQAPATELQRSREQALAAYEEFKQAARATLCRTRDSRP
ncbi:MAG TPA: hypothetical protein PLZ79_13680 [Burkholderiales bacterium]|nr:hypothetical protein [Burkholderiales bacterium]